MTERRRREKKTLKLIWIISILLLSNKLKPNLDLTSNAVKMPKNSLLLLQGVTTWTSRNSHIKKPFSQMNSTLN